MRSEWTKAGVARAFFAIVAPCFVLAPLYFVLPASTSVKGLLLGSALGLPTGVAALTGIQRAAPHCTNRAQRALSIAFFVLALWAPVAISLPVYFHGGMTESRTLDGLLVTMFLPGTLCYVALVNCRVMKHTRKQLLAKAGLFGFAMATLGPSYSLATASALRGCLLAAIGTLTSAVLLRAGAACVGVGVAGVRALCAGGWLPVTELATADGEGSVEETRLASAAAAAPGTKLYAGSNALMTLALGVCLPLYLHTDLPRAEQEGIMCVLLTAATSALVLFALCFHGAHRRRLLAVPLLAMPLLVYLPTYIALAPRWTAAVAAGPVSRAVVTSQRMKAYLLGAALGLPAVIAALATEGASCLLVPVLGAMLPLHEHAATSSNTTEFLECSAIVMVVLTMLMVSLRVYIVYRGSGFDYAAEQQPHQQPPPPPQQQQQHQQHQQQSQLQRYWYTMRLPRSLDFARSMQAKSSDAHGAMQWRQQQRRQRQQQPAHDSRPARPTLAFQPRG